MEPSNYLYRVRWRYIEVRRAIDLLADWQVAVDIGANQVAVTCRSKVSRAVSNLDHCCFHSPSSHRQACSELWNRQSYCRICELLVGMGLPSVVTRREGRSTLRQHGRAGARLSSDGGDEEEGELEDLHNGGEGIKCNKLEVEVWIDGTWPMMKWRKAVDHPSSRTIIDCRQYCLCRMLQVPVSSDVEACEDHPLFRSWVPTTRVGPERGCWDKDSRRCEWAPEEWSTGPPKLRRKFWNQASSGRDLGIFWRIFTGT